MNNQYQPETQHVTFSPIWNMWGPFDTTLSSVLSYFHWQQNDFNIDQSAHFLIRQRIMFVKVHF